MAFREFICPIAVLAMVGCTTIPTVASAPSDFPKLDVYEHEVGLLDVQLHCWKYMPLIYKLLGGVALGCSEFRFAERRCDIYYGPIAQRITLEHEHEHCRGLDHEGETGIADMWRDYKTSIWAVRIGRKP